MDEVRNSPRFAVKAEVRVTLPEGRLDGTSRNLSLGGLCADLDGPIPLGTDCQVAITLVFAEEDTFSEPLMVRGRVVWCTQINNAFQVGLQFTGLSKETVEFIGLFLRYLDGGKKTPRKRSDSDFF